MRISDWSSDVCSSDLFGLRTRSQKIPSVGRWKMLDNLRRSLLAPFALMALGLSWLLPMPSGMKGTLLVLAAVAIPAFLPTFFSVLPHRAGIRLRNYIEIGRAHV